MKRCIYVMESDDGRVKIGMSNSPVARLSSVRSSEGGRSISLVYSTDPVDSPDVVERAVLAALAEHCVGGEWFSVATNHAVAVVEAIAARYSNQAIAAANGNIPGVIWDRFGSAEAVLHFIAKRRPEIVSFLLDEIRDFDVAAPAVLGKLSDRKGRT